MTLYCSGGGDQYHCDIKQAVPEARVIVIGDDGNILKTGLTDAGGVWSTLLTVKVDPRFPEVTMGTVTAIGIAKGFNEKVVFGVPVMVAVL